MLFIILPIVTPAKYLNDFNFQKFRSDCTLNQGVVYNEDEFNKHTAGLAGQLYSVEEQCVLLQGVGSQVCGVSSYS